MGVTILNAKGCRVVGKPAPAVRDWWRDDQGVWHSLNGWQVRHERTPGVSAVWVAWAPDGTAEFHAGDPVTAMERAEGTA